MAAFTLQLPPAWPPAAPAPATLAQSLLLALLLHVLLVLLLGNAPPGTARRGEGVWGAIDVTLRGAATGTAATGLPAPLPEPGGKVAQAGQAGQPGPRGPAPRLRHGGAVRALPPPVPPLPPTPGAARLDDWALVPVPRVDWPADGGRLLMAPAVPVPALEARPAPAPLEATPVPEAPAVPPAALAPVPPRLQTLRATDLPSAPSPAPPLPHQPLAAEPVALPPLQALPRGPLSVAQVPAGTGLAPGVPDAGPEGGRDVAAAPSAPASAPPRLNLELPRLRGGSLSQHGSPGVLELLPRPPERPSKLAREIEKTARDDCRQAYGGAGLLAVVPLLVDSVRQEGCKW